MVGETPTCRGQAGQVRNLDMLGRPFELWGFAAIIALAYGASD